MDGVDVCRAIRRKALEPDVYIILLTGRGEREDIVEGFEAGADDYMTKPFDIPELRARVRTGARIVERQTELIAAREQLRAEAMYDSLTGLLNRSAFFDIFRKEVSRAERYETPLALIMADIDHFKDTNDRYGHPAGDMVLAETARRLRTSLRVSDSIGRYGGEEFVIVAPGCTANSAALLAERFRLIVATQPILSTVRQHSRHDELWRRRDDRPQERRGPAARGGRGAVSGEEQRQEPREERGAGLIAVIAALLALVLAAPGIDVNVSARSIRPGELVVLTLTLDEQADRRDRSRLRQPVPVYRLRAGVWQALVGIDLDRKPGTYAVAVEAHVGPTVIRGERDARREAAHVCDADAAGGSGIREPAGGASRAHRERSRRSSAM